jgi:hypothetical protein
MQHDRVSFNTCWVQASMVKSVRERCEDQVAKAPTIKIENVLQPGKFYTTDAGKYEAMRQAVLKVLPAKSPGMTVAEMQGGV